MANCLQNLLTHTTYCDGKDTIGEMILAACEKGFQSIGFSSHCFMKGCSLPQQILKFMKHNRIYCVKVGEILYLEE